MGTTATLVTVREFLALPEPEGERIELIGGEVISLGRGGAGREWIKGNLIRWLAAWTIQNPALMLLSETTSELSEYDSPIPDVSLYSCSRKPTDMTGRLQGAPDVAIEVVASEKASHLEKKIEL
jgi:Uma2 family endonuclease